MVRFRSPRARPQPSPDPDGPPPGPGASVEPAVLEASAAPASGRRRLRPRPLPSPRPETEPGDGSVDDDQYDEYEDDLEDDELEDAEYWDDEYEDDGYEDEYDELGSDEYEDDEYEDDELEDDEYWDDGYEDDDEPHDGEAGGAPQRARRGRRKLFRRRSKRTAEPAAAGAPLPSSDDVPTKRAPAASGTGLAHEVDSHEPEPVPAQRRRRRPQLPVTKVAGGFGRGVRGVRTGVGRGTSGVRTGVTSARTGVVSAAVWARHHWSRAAYSYLAIVGIALLVTLLLYWRSGFTYDECTYCGVPLLTAVSPWWLLVLPFGFDSWPWLAPLAVLLLFAVINAELVDRWSKRPQPQYPDWE